MSDIIAIIPAKGQSVRVPNKNLRTIDGISLVENKIRQLRRVESVARVVVGTNAEEIAEIAARNGADVLYRDAFHCDETRCPANEMLHDLASRIDGDVVLWAHCTNPFVSHNDYAHAIEAFRDGVSRGYDSLASVTRVQSHLWTSASEPINFEPLRDPHPLASGLDPIFYQNGAIFIQPRAQMVALRYFYGRRPLLYELDEYAGLDINSENDLAVANRLADMFLTGS